MSELNKQRLGSTERTDEQGTYTVYHRQCNYNGCGIDLTSRNRHGEYLMCKPCYLISDRAKPRAKSRKLSGHHIPNPERQRVHNLLTAFLCHPTVKELKDSLLDALVTYEIKERMSRL
jgi:hypothetical protein